MVYKTLDEAYRTDCEKLVRLAKRHIFNLDYAIDAVHDAFTKAAEYLVKKPTARISSYILARETLRACRRLNRFSVEIPCSFERETE